MTQDKDVVCFQCGQSVGEPLRVNTLVSGAPCPACRDRVLDALPSLLPSSEGREKAPEVSADVLSLVESDEDPPQPA